MRIDILTLFPEMCETVMNESIIGRAQKAGKVEIVCTNIRDFSGNKHKKVDDTPYGGGMGMIMAASPIYNCYKSLYNEGEEKPHLIYMSPKGKTFDQKKAIELSKLDRLVLLCGHYEGIDQRVIDEIVDEELSIGDFVLTGGELPALTIADAVCIEFGKNTHALKSRIEMRHIKIVTHDSKTFRRNILEMTTRRFRHQ